jgi:exodeoxyribonuclease VII small subunit
MATRGKAPADGAGEPPDSTRDALRAEVAKLSYEDAREALVDVVRRLESGAETLEESLALWERGEVLARRCEEWLAGAQARIDAATSGDAR